MTLCDIVEFKVEWKPLHSLSWMCGAKCACGQWFWDCHWEWIAREIERHAEEKHDGLVACRGCGKGFTLCDLLCPGPDDEIGEMVLEKNLATYGRRQRRLLRCLGCRLEFKAGEE